MGAGEIDSLEIQVQATAQKANQSLDALVGKLDRLTTSLGKVNGNNLASLSNGVQRLSSSMQSMKNIGTADFTRLAKNIQKMGQLDSKQLGKAAGSIHRFVNALGTIDKINVSDNAAQIGQLANGIKQLGYKSSTQAIENIPKLATAMKQLMTTLSGAPKVSRNLIDMTNALAKLARTGASSGRAANSLGRSLDTYTASTGRASKGTHGLASALGKLYATYWLVFRAFSKIGDAINISSNLTEVQNVVDVTFGNMSRKVEEFANTSIEQFGMSELSLKQYASRFQAMGSAMDISKGLVSGANKFLNEQTKGYVGLSNSMADVSLNLTKLTADMASFYNVEQKDVAEDLASIFTGQTRPLRTYGLDLSQATLKEWALKNGLDSDIKSMSQAEKTMLRYQYVLANTGAAQGDFARTANTWANQIRILKQNFEKLASVIGGAFIQALKPLVSALNTATSHIIAFAETISNALGKIFGWKYESGSGGLTSDFGDAADSADDIADSTGKAAKNIDKMKNGLRAFDELKTISSKDNQAGSGSDSGAGGASGSSGGRWAKQDSILDTFKSDINSLEGLGEYIRNALTNAVGNIKWESVYKKASGFGSGLAGFLNGLFSNDKKGNNVFTAAADVIAGSLNTALHALNSFGETFKWDGFGEGLARGCKRFFEKWDAKLSGRTFSTFVNGLLKSIVSFVDTLNDDDTWGTIVQKFVDFISSVDFKEISTNLSKMAEGLLESIKKAIDATSDSDIFTIIGQKIADFICGIEWHEIAWDFSGLWKSLKNAIIDIPKDFAYGLIDGFVDNIFGEETGKKLQEAIENFENTDFGKYLSNISVQGVVDGIPAFKAIDDFSSMMELSDVLSDLSDDIQEFFDKADFQKWWDEDVSPWFTKKRWQELGKNAKDGIVSKWNEFIAWWKQSGAYSWLANNVKPYFTKEKWVNISNGIKSGLQSKWDEFSIWWKQGGVNKWVESSVRPWFTKEKWASVSGGMKAGLNLKWSEFTSWWRSDGFAKWWSGVKESFSKDKWTFSGISIGLKAAWNNAIAGIKVIWNNFAKWLNDKLNFKWDAVNIGGKQIIKSGSISLGKVPTFSSGGFPEDGLFMANHSELLGKFSNGKTAVANNDQITQGIADAIYPAVYNAVSAAMKNSSGSSNGSPEIRVFVGNRELTDIAIDGINERTRRTGRTPIELA